MTDLYVNYVENMDDVGLQNYMKKELEFLRKIPNSKNRTFVDLGAGYGRLVREISDIASEVIAIEVLDDMFAELQNRTRTLPNVVAKQADVIYLEETLQGIELHSPVFLALQNTLGVIQGESGLQFLARLRKIAENTDGEIVLSLFRQSDFLSWGKQMYAKAMPMIGDVDLYKSDIDNGEIRTLTGYSSKWWTEDDVESIKSEFIIENEDMGEGYYLLRLSPK